MVSALGIWPACSRGSLNYSTSTRFYEERLSLSSRACTSTEVSSPKKNFRLQSKRRCAEPRENSWGVKRDLPIKQERVQDGSCRISRSELGSWLTWCWSDPCRERKQICETKRKSIPRRRNVVRAGNEDEYCDRLPDQPTGACSFRRSDSPYPRDYSETSDPEHSGYTIRVSKELMGVFRYVEKVKRARIKELADTLRQTAAACLFFSCVRGIVGPFAEVFKTQPPSWGKLILMLSAFDSFAITYLALRASEPLEKLSKLATETEKDIMGSIEKEEEHMLALAIELVKLFRRLRNITVCTAVAQFASLAHSLLQLNNPKFVENATKAFGAWVKTPWN